MTLAVVVPSAANLRVTSTTLHFVRAALELGHEVQIIEPWDLRVEDHRVRARAHVFAPCTATAPQLLEQLASRRTKRRRIDLAAADLVLPRMTRPRSMVSDFCQLAAEQGACVVNEPRAARLVANKGWLAAQPDVPTPPSVVTYLQSTGEMFANQFDRVVVKPARGSGGHGVYRVRTSNSEAFEHAWQEAAWVGRGFVVVQQYLPEADDGETRALWLDGEVLGAYRRRRPPDGFQHNLSQGGIAQPWELTDEERAAVTRASPALIRAGVRLAGLDLIGGMVVEANTLNPGGAFHADRLNHTDVGAEAIRRLLAR